MIDLMKTLKSSGIAYNEEKFPDLADADIADGLMVEQAMLMDRLGVGRCIFHGKPRTMLFVLVAGGVDSAPVIAPVAVFLDENADTAQLGTFQVPGQGVLVTDGNDSPIGVASDE
jgi:hypothetical protein